MVITKTQGYYIINGSLISLEEGQVVSYRNDAEVQEFETEQLLLEAHQNQYPELYVMNEEDSA